MKSLSLLLRAFKEAKAFRSLSLNDKKIVFYAEDTHSYIHFDTIIQLLIEEHKETVCYLTSDPKDPILNTENRSIRPYYIGEGAVRTMTFMQLEAKVMVMTMPDLQNYHIKRSKICSVHYLYVFHAMVSTHSNYRKAAFDNYDSIHCTGPYQLEEIRATEAHYQLKSKRLVEIGYPRLESLMSEIYTHRQTEKSPEPNSQKTVIVAPSWGENAILELCGDQVIENLLNAGYRTIVRPHPMTTKHNKPLIKAINDKFKGHSNFQLQLDIRDKSTLYNSDVLVCDWSGVALEYAFACERPVVFINVPQKSNNPESTCISNIPVEAAWRSKIGRIVPIDDLASIEEEIESIYEHTDEFLNSIRELRDANVFNLSHSSSVAAADITHLAN